MNSLNREYLLQKMSTDRVFALQFLFSKWHDNTTPYFHNLMIKLWQTQQRKPSVIDAFRGSAKTTIATEFLLVEALFGNYMYGVFFGETYAKAVKRIEAMQYEVNNNDKIKLLFGEMQGAKWSENRMILRNGVCLEAHGWEEEIRGFNYLNFRPQRVVLDDIENADNTKNTAVVDANWGKFMRQLTPAVDPKSKICLIGTPLADDCMLRRAEASPNWLKLKVPICVGNLDGDDSEVVSNWPDRFTVAAIKAIRDRFIEARELTSFEQEFLLIPSGSSGKPFKDAQFRFVAESEVPNFMHKILIIDPARTTNLKSDLTGWVVVGVNGSKIYIFESGGEKLLPSQIVDGLIFSKALKYSCDVVIESNSLEEWLMEPIRKRKLELGVSIDINSIRAPTEMSKDKFILGLNPYFEAGDIFFVGSETQHKALVNQVKSYPSGKKDVINALAYVLRGVFSSKPVYQNFSASCIISECYIDRSDTLQLIFNVSENYSDLCCVVAVQHGERLVVLRDYIMSKSISTCLDEIIGEIRLDIGGNKLNAWTLDDHLPLRQELAKRGVKYSTYKHGDDFMRCLDSKITVERDGSRLFSVIDGCKNVTYAMFRGYSFPVDRNGVVLANPSKTVHKILIQGIEMYVSSNIISRTNSMQFNAITKDGRPYISYVH